MKLSRVEIITGISKIEPLKKALGKFHITGMTVYQVLGCGVQHGTQEFEVEEKNKEISLLPKEVVMIVLPTEELDGLLEWRLLYPRFRLKPLLKRSRRFCIPVISVTARSSSRM
mgnify:CR=1 FL=1